MFRNAIATIALSGMTFGLSSCALPEGFGSDLLNLASLATRQYMQNKLGQGEAPTDAGHDETAAAHEGEDVVLDDEVYDQDYEDDDEVDPEIAGEEILEIAGEEIPEVEVEPEPEQRGPANLPQPRRHERRASNQFRQLARDALRRLGKRGRR